MKGFYHILGKLVVKAHYSKKLDIYSLCSIHEPELYTRANRKANIPASVRWKVWRRDDFTCHYCGAWGNHLTLDHIVPEKYGGKPIEDNLVTACSSCNGRKSDTSYKEFMTSKWLQKKRKINGYYSAKGTSPLPAKSCKYPHRLLDV